MGYFDMNPNDLDPRVRLAQRESNRRRRNGISAFGAAAVVITLLNVAFFAAVLFVAIHFIAKVW